MGELEVRELRSGEESLWLGSDAEGGPGADGESEKLTKFRRLFEERSSQDPRSFLVALDGPRAAGRLKGLFLSDKLYFVQELHCAEGLPCSVVEDALASFLGDSFSRDGIGILSWDRTKSAETNAALERAGFLIEKKKVFVARGLKGDLPQPGTHFAFRTLAEAGKDEFLRVMTEAAATGGPCTPRGSRCSLSAASHGTWAPPTRGTARCSRSSKRTDARRPAYSSSTGPPPGSGGAPDRFSFAVAAAVCPILLLTAGKLSL